MTLDDLLALPDTDLNRFVAERVMWWEMQNSAYWNIAGGLVCLLRDWSPASDHNDAARVMEEVERRVVDVRIRFANAIRELTGARKTSLGWETSWLVLRATPRQIAAAAIRAAEVLGRVRELEQRAALER